jgi:hypothetical protein
MNREETLAKVEKTVRAIPGVVDMKFLDARMKEDITNLEKQAEKNGACGGMMPFTNKGVWEALARQVSLIIIGDAHLLVGGEGGLIYMMDQEGHRLGEYVRPDQYERIKETDPNAHFLSEDFCMHPDVEIVGEPYFLIDEISFPYLDGVKGVTRVTSGSVSTLTDDWVRNVLGYIGPKMWTHLVGFDLEE